jgi:hypothetical protein
MHRDTKLAPLIPIVLLSVIFYMENKLGIFPRNMESFYQNANFIRKTRILETDILFYICRLKFALMQYIETTAKL